MKAPINAVKLPEPWEYNVQKARSLMEKAGYKYEYLAPPKKAPVLPSYVIGIIEFIVRIVVAFAISRYR